ncbi:MAG TPA: flagellar type III secretion system pore protein FliP [Treponemataceae bacterium]|nr:flagellar type III secretion system pore protein FliP [Treponemataceae bacterium]
MKRAPELRKKFLPAVFFFLLVWLIIAPAALTAQAASGFPRGSATGTTTMNANRQATRIPFIDFSIREPQSNKEVAFSVQLLMFLTILSLAPSILILTTSFLRISIVLDFVKRALSLQQVPPTQVLNGIALFLTLFIMWPTFNEIYVKSFKPLSDGQINVETAYTEAEKPLRLFMYRQMANDTSNIAMFMSMGKMAKPRTLADVPTRVLIPAYILHELTVAFKIGILLYIPFIIVDMVVASVLMSMGMIMLPPVQISMPFKLILFILVDGWGLLTQQLFNSFL